jgi:hypothetical protein
LALPPGLKLDALDGDGFDGELEVVDGAHDGGVEAVGEDLDGERVRGLHEEDAAVPIEGQGIGIAEVDCEVGLCDFAR